MLKLLKDRYWVEDPSLIGKFASTDTKQLYKKNYKKAGKSWFWRDYPVTYTCNSQKYRCPEFDTIDWSENIVMFGCSYTFGVGVSDEQTIASQLTSLGWPTINLGQPGTGPDYQWANSIILKEHKIKPKAVIYFWPDPGRVCQWFKKGNPEEYRLFGSWNTTPGDWGWHYISDDIHSINQLSWYSRCMRLLWDCPVVELTVPVTKDLEFSKKYDKNIKILPPRLDTARDYDIDAGTGHFGPLTNKLWAEFIINELTTKMENKDEM